MSIMSLSDIICGSQMEPDPRWDWNYQVEVEYRIPTGSIMAGHQEIGREDEVTQLVSGGRSRHG